MKEEHVVRRACKEDIGDIINIEDKSFNSDGFSRSQFIYLVTRSKGVFYVAVTDSKVTGYICLLLHSKRKNIRIYSIAILPEYRGRGIAGMLISKAKEFARNEKKSGVSLEVRTDNMLAIQLYEKNGFRTLFTKKQYYHDLTDAFFMHFLFD
ncbi:MAG: ribosomal protein S18-alanine N-acetyltransferase [Prevotella sp.]|jgi:ribosomal-protein-alanine acetyltransferase|nr:ribosomal protein S18-alanine N-acetyltransferase [Prevotella sp.]